jgi:release factor glutamine methyltransferase
MAVNLSRASAILGVRNINTLERCHVAFCHSVRGYAKSFSSLSFNSLRSNVFNSHQLTLQRGFSQGVFSLLHSGEDVDTALAKISQLLEDMSVPEPKTSSRYLVSHALGFKQHHACQNHLDQTLSGEQVAELNRLVACRMARMPIQYIVGNWDFREITLQVRPPVFIPRPETEQLVEIVLNNIPQDKNLRLLEVGPGCGNICLSLLHENKNIHMTALERSKMAAQLTKENASLLNLCDRLEVHEVKVEGSTDLPAAVEQHKYDAIVSNPPYVLRKDLANLESEISLYEDLRALDGGAKGLDVILDILKLANRLLVPDGVVYLEVDPCHPLILPEQLLKQSLPFKVLQTVQDFQGKDRFMLLGRDKS